MWVSADVVCLWCVLRTCLSAHVSYYNVDLTLIRMLSCERRSTIGATVGLWHTRHWRWLKNNLRLLGNDARRHRCYCCLAANQFPNFTKEQLIPRNVSTMNGIYVISVNRLFAVSRRWCQLKWCGYYFLPNTRYLYTGWLVVLHSVRVKWISTEFRRFGKQ